MSFFSSERPLSIVFRLGLRTHAYRRITRNVSPSTYFLIMELIGVLSKTNQNVLHRLPAPNTYFGVFLKIPPIRAISNQKGSPRALL